MKVGILIDQLVSGSAPKTVGQEVRGLSRLGYKSEAIVIKNGFDTTYQSHLSGVPIRCLSNRFPYGLNRFDTKIPGFSFFSLHHLASPVFSPSFVKEKQWDVLVTHASYTCLTARFLRRFRNIPYFAFIGTEPSYFILERIYSKTSLGRLMPVLVPLSFMFDKYVVAKSLAIITFSSKYHYLIKPYSDKPLEVLYPGCFAVEAPRVEREDFILAFDRWDIGNTPNFLLNMLQKLSRKIKLVVAGHWYPSRLYGDFIEEVSKRNLSDQVEVLGPINEAQIIDLCSRALVHVHPNLEAFGMQSLEAAAAGCPIVIPEGSGVTELFQNGVHGFFPRDRDVDSFAENVDKLIMDSGRAVKMGFEAWKVARMNTWVEHCERLSSIINKYVQ